MKIVVLGYSGSGKSTLTKYLGEFFHIPILYMDSVYWDAGWIERDREEALYMVSEFMMKDSWIMDGNYSSFMQAERLEYADYIVYMPFHRWSCLWRVIKRYCKNRNKTRESMAAGCVEKLDMEFIWWVLYRGRTVDKQKKYRDIVDKYKEKVIVISNQKMLDSVLKAPYKFFK